MADKLKEFIESFRKNKNNLYEKVNKSIAQSGILLELESENILQKRKYKASESNYIDKDKDGNRVSRQLDIFASKNFDEISVNFFKNLKVRPEIRIIGDCKYFGSKEICFLCKDITPSTIKASFLRLPFFVNGDVFSAKIHDGLFTVKDFINIFGKIIITKRINRFSFYNSTILSDDDKTKIKIDNVSIEKKEKSIFDTCELQILPALKFYYDFFFLQLQNTYEKFRIQQDNNYLFFRFFIPLLITNREIVEMIIKEKNYEVSDFKSHPFIIYLHSSAKPDRFNTILGSVPEQPIFIINVKYLEKAIDYIEVGIAKLLREMKYNLDNNKKLINFETENYFRIREEKFGIPSKIQA